MNHTARVRASAGRLLLVGVLTTEIAVGLVNPARAGSRSPVLDAGRPARDVPLLQDARGAHYKPRSFWPANLRFFSETTWQRWSRTAVGHGTAHFQAPGGARRAFRTKITLSDVQRLCGGWRYSRAVWNGGKTTFIRFGSYGIRTGG